MKISVYNTDAKIVSEIQLADNVFGARWNNALVKQVADSMLSNMRIGRAHAKGRAEVRGGGRKPWRQKGTGRARHGSIRSPLWKGGGVTHGPTKERNYIKKINKKMKRKALYSVLSKKASEGEIVVIEEISFPEPKTKYAAEIFKKLEAAKILSSGKTSLILTETAGIETANHNKKPTQDILKLAFQNLKRVSVMEARNISVVDALSNKYLLFTKESINGVA